MDRLLEALEKDKNLWKNSFDSPNQLKLNKRLNFIKMAKVHIGLNIIWLRYALEKNDLQKDAALLSTIMQYVYDYKSSDQLGQKMFGRFTKKIGKTIHFLNEYTISYYFFILDLLALSNLLNIDNTYIVNVIRNDGIIDPAYELLINNNSTYTPLNSNSYSKKYVSFLKLDNLHKIVLEGNNEYQITLIQEYLDKGFKKIFNHSDWFNSKKKPHLPPLCFYIAAIVKTKEIDDSSFKNHPYYPERLL